MHDQRGRGREREGEIRFFLLLLISSPGCLLARFRGGWRTYICVQKIFKQQHRDIFNLHFSGIEEEESSGGGGGR